MAQVKIDSINPDMDEERVRASMVSNNEAIRQGFSRITSQILVGLRLKAQKSFGTSLYSIAELSAAFGASGGLVSIKAVLHVHPSSEQNASYSLVVDGVTVDATVHGVINVAGVFAYGDVVLVYDAPMNGQHRVEVKAQAAAGSGLINPYSSLTVIEHLS